jgi:hypothetical protein
MKNSKRTSLGNHYAFHRASAILSQNRDKEIRRVFAEYKDKLVIIAGDIKKEHTYLIPNSKIDHYGDKRIYLNLTEDSERF